MYIILQIILDIDTLRWYNYVNLYLIITLMLMLALQYKFNEYNNDSKSELVYNGSHNMGIGW